MNVIQTRQYHVNDFGFALRKPLFTLISNPIRAHISSIRMEENFLSVITKLALNCLLSGVLFIPATACWMLGKSVYYFNKNQINTETLSLAPKKITIPDLPKPLPDFSLFVDRFEELVPGSHLKASLKNELEKMCSSVQKCEKVIFTDNDNARLLFYQQLRGNLYFILQKLQSNELSDQQKVTILQKLADAAGKCPPTWLQEASKIFNELSERADVSQSVLSIVQTYKEDLILEYMQYLGFQWHGLNVMRYSVGRELGLDVESAKLDPYADRIDNFIFKKFAKWFFLQRYEDTNRLIACVQEKLAAKYDENLYDFFKDAIVKQGIEEIAAGEYIQQNFYTDDYMVTQNGIVFLLKTLGIIK